MATAPLSTARAFRASQHFPERVALKLRAETQGDARSHEDRKAEGGLKLSIYDPLVGGKQGRVTNFYGSNFCLI